MKPIVTQMFAVENKLRTYYTGEPCEKGHLSERHTGTGACLRCCQIQSAKQWSAKQKKKKPKKDLSGMPTRMTGNCCSHCYQYERYVHSGHCVECARIDMLPAKEKLIVLQAQLASMCECSSAAGALRLKIFGVEYQAIMEEQQSWK
jgi:hypothetical protein